MKLTPEQEAFFEYGRATRDLHFAIIRIKSSASKLFGEQYRKLSNVERQSLTEELFLSEYIEDVRRKRAACRAWNPPEGRDCPNCKHYRLLTKERPCRECYLREDAQLWEPRKEGEEQ